MIREAIAIIGVGCRFPGANNPEEFWQLLRDGVDAITEVPDNRWDLESLYATDPNAPNLARRRVGGFLEQVNQFDADFFGISPLEAMSIDPQQRLLLEVAWEALEDAGQIPQQLAGTPTAVFVGISTREYAQIIFQNPIDNPYTATGTNPCIAANRISYFFDFRGPSLAINTACSSSLVAVDLACRSLWSGEVSLALAGGVNLTLLPKGTSSLARAGMLSANGRCKTFDASADGYVRGEGVGIVVLKPLNQALSDGDPIYAVIRGSAVNHDGRSNGITAPNPKAQEAVLREAYRQAAVSPSLVQYVEAHGTGTSLGDPIEMKALGAVLEQGRSPGDYCAVGSVKTNIGHLEAAAGIAGLIKVALSLKHRQIPPSLHFQKPNPYIPFDKLPLQVQQTLAPWPKRSSPASAGVSSFSFGGTNAHVVMEEAPLESQKAKGKSKEVIERPLHLLTLSAKSESSLRELAQRYQEFLASHPEESLFDICFAASTGRSHFDHRLAIVAESTVQLCEQLGAFAALRETVGLVSEQVNSRKRPKVAFLFTGQGSQYIGMGRQLYDTQPTFRASLDFCDELLRPYLEKPLLSVLYPEAEETSPLDETAYTQPALFALEYALFQLWKSWGIEPSVVMGHSVGEYVAACVAGVFSLEDGLKLIAARARLMQALPQDGVMVSVLANQQKVTTAIEPYTEQVSLAALNGSESVVISGERQAISKVVAALEAEGIKTKTLKVSHAFHSPLMEPMLTEFEKVAQELTYYQPRINLISNVTGQPATSEIATPEYWCRHIRQPVKFAASIETLSQQGYEVFVECGPKAILLGMGCQCLPEGVGLWLPSLRPGQEDWQTILQSLGQLYVRGVKVDWLGFDQGYTRCKVTLPTYPFQRQCYWVETHQPQPLVQRQNSLPFWESLVEAGRNQSQQGPLDLALHTQSVKSQALDRLTTAYIINALQVLGVYSQSGESHSVETLLIKFNILPRYRRLLDRWLTRLADVGVLQQQQEIFVSLRPLPQACVETQLCKAKEQLSNTPYLLDFLNRCGDNLADVLVGKVNPVDLLFPGGSFEMAEGIYQHSSEARYFTGIAREILKSVVKTLPQSKPVQILEVGAGTGGTTASLLPVLPVNQTSYWYTDLSEIFLAKAKQKFKTYPFVDYGLLDIEQNPQAQGYKPHGFDVIVAANVLHATRNLGETLQHVRSLLAPGGVLLIWEVTHPQSWLDITFGLFEGWQRHEDDYRQDNPLLSPEQWKNVLLTHGFEEVVAFPEVSSAAEVLGQHILVARPQMSVAIPEGRASVEVLVRGLDEHIDNSLGLVKNNGSLQMDGEVGSLRLSQNVVSSVQPEERQPLLEGYLREQVCKLLRLAPSQLDMQQPLNNLGVDSLMVIELKNQIEINLGIAVTMADLPTISVSRMATQVLEKLAVAATGDNWEEGEL